jgi:hypothetical protein
LDKLTANNFIKFDIDSGGLGPVEMKQSSNIDLAGNHNIVIGGKIDGSKVIINKK